MKTIFNFCFYLIEVEQSSYEDDLQILRVIEAYCTSKQRQTITNSGQDTILIKYCALVFVFFSASISN
jgi:hypothetical protein